MILFWQKRVFEREERSLFCVIGVDVYAVLLHKFSRLGGLFFLLIQHGLFPCLLNGFQQLENKEEIKLPGESWQLQTSASPSKR